MLECDKNIIIKADCFLLERIMENLIGNALKYVEYEGKIDFLHISFLLYIDTKILYLLSEIKVKFFKENIQILHRFLCFLQKHSLPSILLPKSIKIYAFLEEILEKYEISLEQKKCNLLLECDFCNFSDI